MGSKLKTQSAKAKGRRLQQWVRDLLIEKLEVHPEDVESRSMGAGGEDLIMARAAREKFPYSIECKNQEKVNIWESYSQAVENSKDYEPIVVLKRNNHKPLVLVDAEYFIGLHKDEINHNNCSIIINDGVGTVYRDGKLMFKGDGYIAIKYMLNFTNNADEVDEDFNHNYQPEKNRQQQQDETKIRPKMKSILQKTRVNCSKVKKETK